MKFTWTVYAIEARIYSNASTVADWSALENEHGPRLSVALHGTARVSSPVIRANRAGMCLVYTFHFPADSYRFDPERRNNVAVVDPHKRECAEILKTLGFTETKPR